jgi:hypothetical protein
MDRIENETAPENRGKLRVDKGRIYFSREAERKFYFGLSLMLFLAGLLYKLGILQ